MRPMAMADVLVLRFTGTDAVASGTEAAVSDDGSWPAAWLPGLLVREEEATDDDVVHRYRGARALYTAGCRFLEVAGSAADPGVVRLTAVWPDDEPSARKRAAFVSWWAERSAAAGWEPADSDDLVGTVEVARYVPTETPVDDAGGPVVVHEWGTPRRDHTSRTSGRRT
jgi:hypothetical protein